CVECPLMTQSGHRNFQTFARVSCTLRRGLGVVMRKLSAVFLTSVVIAFGSCASTAEEASNPYGWINTETLKTRFGDFEFKNGYPVGDTAERLLDIQKLNRAVEVYTTQMMPVSEIAVREGLRDFGLTKSNQVIIWEQLMGPQTVLLT